MALKMIEIIWFKKFWLAFEFRLIISPFFDLLPSHTNIT